MDITVTRKPPKKGRPELYKRLEDGSYACEEAQVVCITVASSKPATADVEGIVQPPTSFEFTDDACATQWLYRPDTFAGRTRFNISCGTEDEVIELDIAPASNKLGREAFFDLISELEERTPGLPWGISPGHFQGLITKRSPLVVRPPALEHLLDDLKTALIAFRNDPLYKTVRIREMRKMSFNQKIEPTVIHSLATSPQAAMAWAGATQAESGEPTPIFVEQSRTIITHDHHVTRYMTGLIKRLGQELRKIELYLKRAAEGKVGGIGDEQARTYCARLADTVRPISALVTQVLTLPPLAGLQAEPFTESAAQALLDHPPSLRLHRLVKLMLSAGLSPDQKASIYGGLRETWELYEYLVLFRMADGIAKQLGEGWAWAVSRPPQLTLLRDAPATGVIQLANAKKRIELHTQQHFMPLNQETKSGEFSSLSTKRSPDYLLGIFDQNDTLKSWLVLDAKFRTHKEGVLDGMSKIHIYRDSLRWNGLPPTAGYAIVPKTVSRTERYATNEYRAEHNFGLLVCPLTPEPDWLSPIIKWIADTL